MNIYVIVGCKYGDWEDSTNNLEVTTDTYKSLTAKPEDYGEEIDYIIIETWKNEKLDKVSSRILRK